MRGDFYLTPSIFLQFEHASLHKSVSCHAKIAMLKFDSDMQQSGVCPFIGDSLIINKVFIASGV